MDYLLRQVSALMQVKRKRWTWNECGEAVIRNCMNTAPKTRDVRDSGEAPASTEAAYWNMAKALVHAVLAARDPKHDAIRKRLGSLHEPSTPRLLSTLGLWLAGVMGISVSVTGPMVAVMLYAAGEADGSWEVLRDSNQV